jgi:hypothetical protein
MDLLGLLSFHLAESVHLTPQARKLNSRLVHKGSAQLVPAHQKVLPLRDEKIAQQAGHHQVQPK